MRFPFPLYSPAGATEGGSASPPSGGASAPGGASVSSPPASGAGSAPSGMSEATREGSAQTASQWKAPDYLPENLRGEDVGKTFEKVAADWQRLRGVVSGFEPPKSIEEYKFTPSDKVKPHLGGDLAADPVFALMKEAALKAGVPAKQFEGVLGAFYEGLVDKRMAPKPFDIAAEQGQLLGPQAAAMTQEQRDQAVRPILMPLVEQLETLNRTSAFSQDPAANKAAFAAVAGLLDSAAGVRALQALLKGAGPAASGLNPGGGAPTGQLTASQLRARQGDPRNVPGGFNFDASFRAETDRLYREMYG